MSDLITRTHWHHPEWVALAVSAEGWLLLASVLLAEPAFLFGGLERHTPSAALTHAAIMSAAMMTPLVLEQANHVAVHSLWPRRYRAVGFYLVGYLTVWTLVAAVMMSAAAALVADVGAVPVLAATWTAAVLAVARARRRYLVAQCWATRPLALRGLRADLDVTRLGVDMARRCVAASWTLMLAVTVQHGLLAMACGTLLVLGERSKRLDRRQVILGTTALGVLCIAVTLLAGAPPEAHGTHEH